MFIDIAHCGSIEDVELGIRWDRTTLAKEVARRAANLARMGIGRGAIVAIAHGGSALFFADLLAVWAVGAAAACLDSALTELELQTVLDFMRPAALLVACSPPAGSPSIPILELASTSPPGGATTPMDVDLRAPALVLFTSGTTGLPKAVVLSFQALKARIELNAAAIGQASLRRALVTLPTHFGHGLIGNSLTPLVNGGDIVILPRGIALADRLGHIIDAHDISFLSSVPSFWRIATQSAEPPSKNTLLRVHVGSAPLAADLWSGIAAWSRAEVINCYGMTETANWFAGASSRTDFIADGFVGRPWGGAAAVRSDRGDICTVGEGEVVVRAPSLMQGYLNHPEMTAAVMPEGWYRTGDRGRVDEFGRIWLTGRIKDEINRAGVKVQPAEIDMLLERHPAVAEACVFAVPDAISGEAVGAAVRLAAGQNIGIEGLRAWCRERLNRNAVPGHWFIVDGIPRSARGKVNRDAVRRMLIGDASPLRSGIGIEAGRRPITAEGAARRGAAVTNADADSIKNAVARAWTKVLGLRPFHADMRWNDAGGDSLGALHLLANIENQLAIPLPIGIIRGSMRPSELLADIERISACREADCRRPDPGLPLVFLAPPAYGDVPGLAQFREALAECMRFHVIQYPPLSDMIDGRAGFAVLVDAAVKQVLAMCGEGPCLIAGYSFGGFIAREAARRIIATGRRVDFLGLIDSRLDDPPRQRGGLLAKAGGYLGRSWSQPRKVYRDGLWWLSDVLARQGPLPLLRIIDRVTLALPASVAFAFRLELLTRLRAHSLRGAKVGPLDVATTLFCSAEPVATARAQGWETLCAHLVVRSIDGNHRSLFEPQFRASLCVQFLEAVETACRVARLGRVAPTLAQPPPAAICAASDQRPLAALLIGAT